MKTNIRAKHRIGSKVTMTEGALQNYGDKYRGKTFTVSHVATKYMPAERFYAEGRPAGFHPGFDEGAGCALYDLNGLNFSLYEWEVI
jgi:hypothetical protein